MLFSEAKKQMTRRMTAREFGSQSFHRFDDEPRPEAPEPAMITVDQWDYAQGRFVERMVPNPALNPEDERCECIQIREDFVDASFCRIHGQAPAPPVEFQPATTPTDKDVEF
jgi:hypothetical protein